MKVVGHHEIKGAGTATLVDALDANVNVGSIVRKVGSDFTWRVKRQMTHLMGRDADTGYPGEFILEGLVVKGPPMVGWELEVVE